MTSINYLSKLPSETSPRRLCLRKAVDCQYAALATADPQARRWYLRLAKHWREMADTADLATRQTPSKEKGGVVISFPRRTKR